MTSNQRQLLVVAVAFLILGPLSLYLDWPWWQFSLLALVPVGLGMWWAVAGARRAQR